MKRRFIGLAAVYMLIPAMLLAQSAGKKQLVGVWAVKEAPVEHSQSSLLSLAMFGGDGSFTHRRWIQDAATNSRGSRGCDGGRHRGWTLGRRGQQGIPPDVLRVDPERKRRDRIPASAGHLGFVRIG